MFLWAYRTAIVGWLFVRVAPVADCQIQALRIAQDAHANGVCIQMRQQTVGGMQEISAQALRRFFESGLVWNIFLPVFTRRGEGIHESTVL